MNARTILFPTDFSHCGDAALEMATSLALESGAKLLIVHVEEPAAGYGGGELFAFPLDTTDDLLATLTRVIPTDPNVAYEHRLVTGEPAHAIVRLATQENADMIVIGTHGRTGLTRLLMGSVAESVVRRAACPVITVKQNAEMAQQTH
ncbi:MAG: universal stress protein [Planctomycetota bacterium]|nr:universal stress protein [Planctomycetota bacterium]